MNVTRLPSCATCIVAVVMLFLFSCSLLKTSGFVTHTIETGGEERATRVEVPASPNGPRMIIFALDGAVPAGMMDNIKNLQMPHVKELLGNDEGDGLFEHGYAAPEALSVLPSSTIADWASIFTGSVPAWDGIPGDEWFDRETATFFAPVPVSMTDVADNTKLVTDDLIGNELKVPTLYERLRVRSYVSMLSVHRGATFYTTVGPDSLSDLFRHLVRGALMGREPERSLSATLDRASVEELNKAIDEHGIPDLQVVYFPGIDIFTHAAEDPLNSQMRYLAHVTDGAIGQVLDEYNRHNALDNTYVIFISDHSHIPTMNDEEHRLGPDDDSSPFKAVAQAGFRVRKASLILGDFDQDFQAVLAYQGSMANIYLADRTTCPDDDDNCDWKKPPRFQEDVMPVLKSLYQSNRRGRPIAGLKGKLDLIFSRQPTPSGTNALPFEVFDGQELIPIDDYLSENPRPDLPELSQRMRWLGAGPYGNRAGDIVLLPKACMNVPIENRYYFAGMTHYSWHGSACEQDGHIPFILAQAKGSGEKMRSIMNKFGGATPSERKMTPLVVSIFGK
jgi:predicted AlkP superfamily pyrophosphatase or phosphodiesterase